MRLKVYNETLIRVYNFLTAMNVPHVLAFSTARDAARAEVDRREERFNAFLRQEAA